MSFSQFLTLSLSYFLMEILNRKAKYEYQLVAKYEAGLVWKGTEVDRPTGERKTLDCRRLFEERISREIRRGGRMALVVELAVAEASGGRVTVVSTHLENKAPPACRQS